MMLALALAMSGLPFLFGTVYYMVADDYLLNYIANGSYGWEYSDHLVFIRMPLGWLLKTLYGITTSVNWYFVLFLLFTVLSFALLHLFVWRRTRSFVFLALSAFFNYMIVAHFLSFTVVSYLCAAAGFCALGCALKEGRSGLRWGFLCAALFLISFFMRRQAALVSILMYMPLLVVSVMRQGKKCLRQLLIPAAAAAALFLLALVYENVAYSSPEWKEYREYNSVRSEVVDNYFVNYEAVKEELNAIGIGRLDYSLLASWRYCEKPFFTKEILEKVSGISKKATTLQDRIAYTRQNLNLSMLPFLIAPLFLLAALFLTGKLKDKGFAVLNLLLIYGLIFAFAFIRLRFVMRVVMPTQLFGAYALVGFADPEGRGRRVLLVEAVSAVLIVLCSLQYLQYFQRINPVPRTYYQEAPLKDLTDEIAAHPETLYVFDASALSHVYYYGTPASQVKTTEVFRNVTRTGSWDSYSPRYYQQVSALLKDPDRLITGLVSEENIAYVTGGEAGEITGFYEEQTGKGCAKSKTEYPGTGFAVWRLREE